MISLVSNRVVYHVCMNEVRKPIVSWSLQDSFTEETMGIENGCDTNFVLPTRDRERVQVGPVSQYSLVLSARF